MRKSIDSIRPQLVLRIRRWGKLPNSPTDNPAHYLSECSAKSHGGERTNVDRPV